MVATKFSCCKKNTKGRRSPSKAHFKAHPYQGLCKKSSVKKTNYTKIKTVFILFFLISCNSNAKPIHRWRNKKGLEPTNINKKIFKLKVTFFSRSNITPLCYSITIDKFPSKNSYSLSEKLNVFAVEPIFFKGSLASWVGGTIGLQPSEAVVLTFKKLSWIVPVFGPWGSCLRLCLWL